MQLPWKIQENWAIANCRDQFRRLQFIWRKKQIFHFDLSCLISPFKWTKDTKDTNDTNVRQIDDQKTPILGVVHMPKQTQLNLVISDLCFLWEIIVQKNWIIHWFLPGINYPRILQTAWLNLACSFLPSATI